MVEMNLMAWRAEKERYERNGLRLLIGASIAMTVCVILVVQYGLTSLLRDQENKVNRLSQKLESIPRINDEGMSAPRLEKFISPLRVKEMLVFAGATTSLGVCYQKITRDENRIALFGQAATMISAPAALQYLKNNSVFTGIKLRDLKYQDAHQSLQFTFDTSDALNAPV